MLWRLEHTSRASLPEQIAACVRRGVRTGELGAGDRVPPAHELAEALSVDRNTVLAAYRLLRDAGVLEFRRGRGARVTSAAPVDAEVGEAARHLLDTGRRHGYDRAELLKLIEEMA